jgi:DNA invertase Pin-like site-specific DNA recombinase
MKAAVYVRISPTYKDKEETITGLAKSIESALEICRRKARGEGDEIVKEYIDQYVSGKSQEHMKSFTAMIQDAKRNHFQRIYCRRVDRFGRNLDEMIKTEIELHSVGVSLYFVEENIDTRSEIGRLVMNILSHVAEWKRREILENTQRGREELKRQIEAGTTDKRFGRTAKKINIRSVIDMKNKGMTWATISDYVNVSVPTIQKKLKEAGYKFEKGYVVKA